jgi:short-subunit dehydrogenase
MQDCEKIVGFGIQGVIGSEKRRREADTEAEQADQEMREVAVEVVDDEPKKSVAHIHKSILSQKVKISFMVNQNGFIAPGDALDQ